MFHNNDNTEQYASACGMRVHESGQYYRKVTYLTPYYNANRQTASPSAAQQLKNYQVGLVE